ncbi:hypothetical protein NX059_005699 [Plenodomus lindquistii]|nr:hypothetical protein NX059_005699 [Plenodomus lindquistii]
MRFLVLFAALVTLVSSAHAQFSGYYNISTAMSFDAPVYLHFDNRSLDIVSYRSVTIMMSDRDDKILTFWGSRYESLQQWYFTGSPSGYYFIANRQGGVLSANGIGRQVRGDAFDPDAIDRQAWRIKETDAGLYEYVGTSRLSNNRN